MKLLTIFVLFVFVLSVIVVTFTVVQLNEYYIADVIRQKSFDYDTISSVNINDNMIIVEIADDNEERIQGLMFRDELDYNSGMLFVFNNEKIRSFWMKNTYIPLDMIFISSNKTIVDIHENTEPCKTVGCKSYISNKPARYVLEVNSGYVSEKGFKVGDEVEFLGFLLLSSTFLS